MIKIPLSDDSVYWAADSPIKKLLQGHDYHVSLPRRNDGYTPPIINISPTVSANTLTMIRLLA